MLEHAVEHERDRLDPAVRVPLEPGLGEPVLGERQERVGRARVARHDHDRLVVDLGVRPEAALGLHAVEGALGMRSRVVQDSTRYESSRSTTSRLRAAAGEVGVPAGDRPRTAVLHARAVALAAPRGARGSRSPCGSRSRTPGARAASSTMIASRVVLARTLAAATDEHVMSALIRTVTGGGSSHGVEVAHRAVLVEQRRRRARHPVVGAVEQHVVGAHGQLRERALPGEPQRAQDPDGVDLLGARVRDRPRRRPATDARHDALARSRARAAWSRAHRWARPWSRGRRAPRRP